MKFSFYILILFSLFFLSCNNEPSLQKYFVDNSAKKDFIAMDVSSSIINVDKTKLSNEQKDALASFDKINALVFKLDETNKAAYAIESEKVKQILKGKEYQELMKFGSGKDAASVSIVGDDNDISEFVFFAKKKENGFAVVRILGNDMNPTKVMNMVSLLQSSDINMEQLKPLQELIK